MPHMFQIHEEDLAELERLVPQVADAACTPDRLTPKLKTQLRRVKDILSNVRWNYGPPQSIEIIPADE